MNFVRKLILVTASTGAMFWAVQTAIAQSYNPQICSPLWADFNNQLKLLGKCDENSCARIAKKLQEIRENISKKGCDGVSQEVLRAQGAASDHDQARINEILEKFNKTIDEQKKQDAYRRGIIVEDQ